MATVADVIHYLNDLYPEATAEPWDAVGLTVGREDARVSRVLFAVDIDPIVVAEAIEMQAQLLVTHHPLYLSGTTTVAATTPKGSMVHDLISRGIALYTAHTNADIAPLGVSDALAHLLGIRDTAPLAPSSNPHAHPGSGAGRIGHLADPITVREFAHQVGQKLPTTAHGVRVHGDLERPVRRVAVCGGSGDSYLAAAHEAGADLYLTSDLRHHKTSEAGHLPGAPALVDVAHFASEWAWLPRLSELVAEEFGLQVPVSILNTDPWTIRLPGTDEGDTE